MTREFDQQYYAGAAERMGWGSSTAVLDAERSAYLVENISGETVLDVGCATGIYVDHLVQNGYRASGVDFSAPLIADAKKKFKGEFSVANAYKLPFKDKSFDTVLLLDILEHIDDTRALKEAARVAAKRVIIVVPAQNAPELEQSGAIFRDYLDPSHLRYYDDRMLEELTSKIGLKPKFIKGVAEFDFGGLIMRTISFKGKNITNLFFKAFFTLLKRAKVKKYYSEKLMVIDL